jgi:hypothetical protein
MVNLTAREGFDASSSKGSSIPTGAIIMSAKTYSLDETIQNDRCPCDGRSLNTYDYANLHKVISNSFGGAAYSQGVTDQVGAVTTFNVPALMPTSSYTPTGDSRDQRYIGGSNTPASLSSSLTAANHTHNITGISSPAANTNATLDQHTHTIAARTHTTTVNDNNHTFSNPVQNLGNSAGTSQRNDGTTVGSGLSHQHNVNSSTTRATSPGTTAVPNHTHSGYTAIGTSEAASKPAHSHAAAAVTSELVEDYAGPSYIRVVYYIKL